MNYGSWKMTLRMAECKWTCLGYVLRFIVGVRRYEYAFRPKRPRQCCHIARDGIGPSACFLGMQIQPIEIRNFSCISQQLQYFSAVSKPALEPVVLNNKCCNT